MDEECFVINQDDLPTRINFGDQNDYNVTIYARALLTFGAWGMVIYHRGRKIRWHAEYLPTHSYTSNEDV